MHKQYSAEKLLATGRLHWPETDKTMDEFAIYLYRTQQLSLKHGLVLIGKHQINGSEFDVLAALRTAAPPHEMTPTELQRSLLITSGGLTKLLYQLEANGYISRSVQEQDKRSKMVHLTKSGKSLIEKSMQEVHTQDRTLLDSALSKTELSQLVNLLSKVTRALEDRDGGFTSED